MKILFVVNPISGGIDKEPFLVDAKLLCEKYGIDFQVFKTTGKQDQKHLTDAVSKYKPDRVASVGGDGTTLFTAVVLKKTKIPMGIIPLGSANGMAAELMVNLKPLEALRDLLLSNVIGHLDMLKVNDAHYSIHIGDVGINAQIVQSYENDENRGLVTYAKYFLEKVNSTTPFDIVIEANGETIKEHGVMAGICNCRKYGTGIPLNIEGNPMDGKFEIVVVKKIDANLLLKAGLSKFNDRFHDSQNGRLISTDKAIIHFDKKRLLQLDGETIGEFEQLKVEIIKGAIQLISHHDNTYMKHTH
ncbi:diacylglycerol kinase family protein [Reichenbachiella carrageenanivorans]|uniref:Diacylglycerol kinase family protein n=1 Tax=Reichenbachiella carrageenanivorans TaxID=2979869 RepID=A0ABY6D4I6_9BACT|nr:diacylglycerol kinase family protein [Reichenbachiella carrageenanivorans]UXX81056.1 diacylglycerol kinase family protein [Reichenbachiella carrageenanivorans]